MKIATISEIKRELINYTEEDLRLLCLRLVKHKKESKELLHYLLFEASDEQSFILAVQEEIEEGFAEMNKANLYWAKKSIRKILRNINKYIRFSGQKETEVALRLFYCRQILKSGLAIQRSAALFNLYKRQVTLIEKAIGQLHPDLQFDYEGDLTEVSTIVK